jgi:hypothetical protein
MEGASVNLTKVLLVYLTSRKRCDFISRTSPVQWNEAENMMRGVVGVEMHSGTSTFQVP